MKVEIGQEWHETSRSHPRVGRVVDVTPHNVRLDITNATELGCRAWTWVRKETFLEHWARVTQVAP